MANASKGNDARMLRKIRLRTTILLWLIGAFILFLQHKAIARVFQWLSGNS